MKGTNQLLSLVVAVFLPAAQALSFAEKTTLIENFVEDVMQCSYIPGLTLAVAGRDAGSNPWTYVKGFGKADVGNDVDVTTETLFNVASTTKAFTATLLAILLEESNGQYTWDTPIKDILGNSFLLPDEYTTNKVNLVDLLSHRVGLTAHDTIHLFGFVEDQEQLIERLHLLTTTFDFRTNFLYSNAMFTLAGAVAEKIGGKSWEALIKEKILDPLGMDSTTFVDQVDLDDANFARAHYLMNNRTLVKLDYILAKNTKAILPAAGIASNAEDMAKWIHFVLSGGKSESGRTVLSTLGLLRTMTPANHLPPSSGTGIPPFPVTDSLDTYGLGWFIGYYRGYRHISHSGSILGYESMMTILPQMNLGVFVSVNGALTELCILVNRFINNYVIDVILDKDPWMNSSTACSFPEPWVPMTYEYYPGPKPFDKTLEADRPLQDYEGVYGNFAFGEVHVKFNDTLSALEVTGGNIFHFALYPSAGEDAFEAEGLGIASYYTARDTLKGIGQPPLTTSATFSSTKGNNKIDRLTFVVWSVEVMVFDKGIDPRKPPKPDFVNDKCSAGARYLADLFPLMIVILVGLIVSKST